MYRLDEIPTPTKGFHYLASPYSLNGSAGPATRQANYVKAVDALAHLTKLGLTVFSPIAHWHDVSGHLAGDSSHVWLERCAVFLRDAESLVVLMAEGWDVSAGVQWEIAFAESNNIPILYVSMEGK
jgi:hypothetical protein